MIRKQVYLTTEQDRALKRLAYQLGSTESLILRDALDRYFSAKELESGDDPLRDLIGLFNGPEEVDHDDVYE